MNYNTYLKFQIKVKNVVKTNLGFIYKKGFNLVFFNKKLESYKTLR